MAALTEILYILNALLLAIPPDVVIKFYLQPRKPNSYTITKLLANLPIELDYACEDQLLQCKGPHEVSKYIENSKHHALHLFLIKLVVSCANLINNASLLIELVLPSVDKFFSCFVEQHQFLPIASQTIQRLK